MRLKGMSLYQQDTDLVEVRLERVVAHLNEALSSLRKAREEVCAESRRGFRDRVVAIEKALKHVSSCTKEEVSRLKRTRGKRVRTIEYADGVGYYVNDERAGGEDVEIVDTL